MYAIRIHKEFTDLEFLQNQSVFMVLEREAAREHYQGVIEWSKTSQALRVMVKKNCPKAVGNSGYSVTQITETPEVMIRYLCKGTANTKPEVVINTIGVENIDQLWEQYWETNKTLRQSKKEKKSIIDKVEELFPWVDCTCNNVTDSVVNYLIEHNKPINPNYVQGLVLLILAKKNPNYRRELISSLIRKNNLLL